MYTWAMKPREKYLKIYKVVRCIPIGRVATSGQVATIAGYPGQARQVGYALNNLSDDNDVPWQRVINAQGRISPRANPIYEEIQQRILEAEGIEFDERGMVDLDIFQWIPGEDTRVEHF